MANITALPRHLDGAVVIVAAYPSSRTIGVNAGELGYTRQCRTRATDTTAACHLNPQPLGSKMMRFSER